MTTTESAGLKAADAAGEESRTPASSSRPAMRSESCTFIWQP